ncbi:ATPase associated with various cellular activities family protein [Lyngbya aestuarii BL J]|uniref:ATPase associated with various cellular activities family protein n=1 Tax=Lyngbya aestuarii BL J TaxID=1348334 RepID=U7QDG6_9CYAN|nr:ribulose bisphosphate carboxylase small subunit [Lyngbya aestuarii]ERT05045.1 ATPase associated with various cellular activities family protein [Lyngbya aestuarii BL J]
MSYYISPRFLDKLAVHITKNFLKISNLRVPLILGIHGRKGEGKTFQCELVFEKMGFEPVTISGGELESPDAGDPSRLIRLRYREASEQSKVRGQMCALFINDIDAGAGRFDSGTQYTVNTQLVNATLMNIADNPTNVQLPGSYDETPLQRIPVIVTGNDFSTLYAPLIRDGRMEKFYWEPVSKERIEIVEGIFQQELLKQDIIKLVDEFPDQSIDFFSALRSRIYDEQIQHFIHQMGIEKISKRIVNSTEKPPEFNKPNFKFSHLLEMGHQMVAEQRRIQELRLVEEYNQNRIFHPDAISSQRTLNPVEQKENYTQKTHLPYNPVMPPHRVDSKVTGVMQGDSKGSTFISEGQAVTTKLSLKVLEQIEQIIEAGYRVGLEYADSRRFKTGSWKTCSIVDSTHQSEIMAEIEACISEHPNDYVRLIGIDTKAKRRIIETIIQRPNP